MVKSISAFSLLLASACLATAQDVLPVKWQIPGPKVQSHMKFSPDGRYFMTFIPGRPGLVTVRDGETKKVLWQYGKTCVVGAEFSSDSKMVLVSSDLEINKLQVQNGLGAGIFGGGIFGFLTRVPGTGLIMVAKRNTPVGLYDSAGAFVRNLPFTFTSAANGAELRASDQGGLVAAQGNIARVDTGAIVQTYPATKLFAFAPSGSQYITQPALGRLQYIDIATGGIIRDKTYNYSKEIVQGGETIRISGDYVFISADPGSTANGEELLAGYLKTVSRAPGDIYETLYARVWSLNLATGELAIRAEPEYRTEDHYFTWNGPVTSVVGTPNGQYAWPYSKFYSDGLSMFDTAPAIPRIFPVSASDPSPMPSADLPADYGYAFPVSPAPLPGETGYAYLYSPGNLSTMTQVNRNTGSAQIPKFFDNPNLGTTQNFVLNLDGTTFAYDVNNNNTSGDFTTGIRIGSLVPGGTRMGYFLEIPKSAPVFVGNSRLAVITNNGTQDIGRIADVETVNGHFEFVPRGTFPVSEIPLAGRRNGLGLATRNADRVAFFELAGTNPISATLKGVFPSFKKSADDLVKKWNATFTSGDNLAVVAAVYRATTQKTEVEYRLYDVKSTVMRTLESRTLGSYSSTWKDSNIVLALSTDGAQSAILLDRLTIAGGNSQGYSGQVDFVRNSDGVYTGRYSDQQVGWGFLSANFDSITRGLVATRRDGAAICFAVPPQMYSVAAPADIYTGSYFDVVLTLRGVGAPGGSAVRVSYGTTSIYGPSIVFVPEGSKTYSFRVNVMPSGPTGPTSITAKIGNDAKTALMTVH